MEAIFVTGAVVSAKTRHMNNRHELTINIRDTQLNHPYGGELVARGEVRTELNKQGLNSYFSVISWNYR
ncbi:hypothetical protein AB6D66_00345 [Vibrio pomeroyi]|uniref:Single-stranded DNA-binding protein n=1 Tax=Vibrio pomeroyi TaxID=198832 RepID=A0ABV4MQS0_9VIBR|nr:hypothetical protein [Vibrio atlanticus]MCZ4310998.1 hypothetical protein [Vibrio atlanticus]